MKRRHRYVGLVAGDRNPFAVLRISESVEEIHVPGRGWESADPRWREWFENVALEPDHALGLLDTLEPAELREDEDPYAHALTRDAADGFGTQTFYYAVETAGHPLEDPLSLVSLHYPSKSEWTFGTDLRWGRQPVEGRRARISQEELRRLEEVLVRRAFGGAEVQHYAVLNPFYPDPAHPAAIARVGPEGEQRYAGDGRWVSTGVVTMVRNRYRHGEFVLLTEEEARRLADRWRPHPDSSRVRYFAWLSPGGHPWAVMRAWDVDGGVEEESYVDGKWGGRRRCVFADEQARVEVDRETALRHGAVLDAYVESGGPEDGRYDYYYAILREEFDDVSTAHDLVRTWGGRNGHLNEQSFHPLIDGWRWCMTVYEIWTDRNRNYAIPISREVAEELRRVLRAAAIGEERPRRPLGKWAGFGEVALTGVDDRLLDSLREVGDPPADQAVAELYERGDIGRVNEALAGFTRNGDEVPPGLPPVLERYLRQAGLPEWADRAVLACGQELWDRYAPHLAAALCCYALPVRYAAAVHHMHPELESVRLLRDVLAGGGLSEPDGRGLRTLQKVRLSQAVTRRRAGGAVAGQEELAATAGSLSVLLAQGLRRMTVVLPDRDLDDLFHIFTVAGHVLGLDPRLTPKTYGEGVMTMSLISRRRRTESAAVAELGRSLRRRVEAALPPPLAAVVPTVVNAFCVHDRTVSHLLWIPTADLSEWQSHYTLLAEAADVPAGERKDDRVMHRVMSEVVGKALLAAEPDGDLALPLPD